MRLHQLVCLLAILISFSLSRQVLAAPDAARQKVTDSQTALTKAEAALKAARAKVQAAFESSADYTAAMTSRKEAQAKFDSASKPILQKLQEDPTYKLAVAKKQELEVRREKLRADPNSTPKEMADAASAVLSTAAVVSKLERDALAGDPSIVTSRTAMNQANSTITELRAGLPEKFKSDPDVQAAQKQVDDNKTTLAQARKDLLAQQAAQAQQAQQSSSRSGGGGGYGSSGGMGGGGKKR